jgi:hypothetical protein
MAFALLSRSRSKPQGSVKPVPKQKSARGQHSADSRFGFAKPVFQPQTAALPTVPVIQAKLKVGEPDDKFEEEADRVAELTGNDNGSIPPSAVARSRSPVGSLQRMYGNQAMLQMRNGSGGLPAPSVPLRPSQSGILQRKCACSGAAGMSGACEECSKKQRLGLQTKLKINEPGDIYEQEADRIADQVMATPAHPAVSDAPPRIQRFAGQSNGQMDAAPASVNQALASPGRPLEPALRQDMEERFGHNFSRVRVHSGTAAEQSARDVNAHAYTVGHDMVFGAGRFAPGTQAGRRLIAHELAHVMQQGRDQPMLQRQEIPGKEFEPCGPVGWGNPWLFVGDIGGGPYVNQRIALPYDKIVPLPDPTEDYDKEEVIRTFKTPSRLEQLYYDAATPVGSFQNRYRAIWLICNAVEFGAREIGVNTARQLLRKNIESVWLSNPYVSWKIVLGEFSEGTASGRRVRGVILKGFIDESFEIDVNAQLVNSALLLLGGLSVARAGLGRTGAPAVPLEPAKPTVPAEPSKPAVPVEPAKPRVPPEPAKPEPPKGAKPVKDIVAAETQLKATSAERIKTLEQEHAVNQQRINQLKKEIEVWRQVSREIRQEANSAEVNKRPTPKGQELIDRLTNPAEKQQITEARKSGKSEADIQETVLLQKARESDAITQRLENEAAGPTARNTAIEIEIRKLKGIISIPERAGGSHKQVSANTKKDYSESHHLIAVDSYEGRIRLSRNEGPAIYMLEKDHKRTASHGSTPDAIKWRQKQADLIEQGKFQEALEMGIKDVREKFPDGRYEKGIKQAQEYAKQLQLDPNKLKPKGGAKTPQPGSKQSNR